jgi:hypothetical protein
LHHFFYHKPPFYILIAAQSYPIAAEQNFPPFLKLSPLSIASVQHQPFDIEDGAAHILKPIFLHPLGFSAIS